MTEKLVAVRFGPGPFSLEGISQLILTLGDIEDDDLRPLAAKLGVPEDSFHIRAVADILGISEEPRELPELYSAVRRLLRAETPVTIVFDDVGAAGPAFFNLLGYLEESLEDDEVIIELRGDPAASFPMTGSGEQLFRAGMRSLGRSDMPAADAFLAAAIELLPAGEDRYVAMAARCDALLAGGRPQDALAIAETGLAEATAAGNERFRARFSFFTVLLGDGSGDLGSELTTIAAALRDAGDHAGAAQAVEANAHFTWDSGDPDGALRLMEEALDHARTALDRQTTTRIVAWLCEVASSGTLSDEDARARVETLSWVASFSPLVEVKRLATLAQLEARAGSFTNALSLIEAATALQVDLGQPGWVSGVPEVTDEIERLAGVRSEQTTSTEDV